MRARRRRCTLRHRLQCLPRRPLPPRINLRIDTNLGRQSRDSSANLLNPDNLGVRLQTPISNSHRWPSQGQCRCPSRPPRRRCTRTTRIRTTMPITIRRPNPPPTAPHIMTAAGPTAISSITISNRNRNRPRPARHSSNISGLRTATRCRFTLLRPATFPDRRHRSTVPLWAMPLTQS